MSTFIKLVTEMLLKDLKADHPLTTDGLAGATGDMKLANAVQTMSTCKEYYTYGGICMCGYRGIRLEGSVDDWNTLDEKFKAMRAVFSQLGEKNPLARWFHLTQLVMDRLIRMSASSDDSQLPEDLVRLMNSAYLECPQGSGGDYFVSGWLGTTLAPVFDNEGTVAQYPLVTMTCMRMCRTTRNKISLLNVCVDGRMVSCRIRRVTRRLCAGFLFNSMTTVTFRTST